MRTPVTEKKERSLGVKLFMKAERCNSPKCATVRRQSRPGMHGTRRKNMTEYGTQLQEKQKIQISYGLNNTQMQKLFARYNPEEIMDLLTHRLDQVVFIIGFARSPSIGRQLVTHGHIMVNGRRVNIPSYQVQKGDVVEIRPESKEMKLFEGLRERFKNYDMPVWFSLNADTLAATCVRHATKEDMQFPFNIDVVGQFYSR